MPRPFGGVYGSAFEDAVPTTRTINNVDLSANRTLAELGIVGLVDATFVPFRPDLTSVSGAGAASLDSLVTATGQWTVGRAVFGRTGASGGVQMWALVAGTNATAAGQYQRPLDYNGSTNQKVWQLVA